MRTRAEVNQHHWAILGVAVAVACADAEGAYYQLVWPGCCWGVLSLAWNI